MRPRARSSISPRVSAVSGQWIETKSETASSSSRGKTSAPPTTARRLVITTCARTHKPNKSACEGRGGARNGQQRRARPWRCDAEKWRVVKHNVCTRVERAERGERAKVERASDAPASRELARSPRREIRSHRCRR
eukprot:468500-Pleurochrysis_carterae.AAC.3